MGTRLPLTDRLAVERTRLANERTLLAYIRTALAGFGLAFLLMRFTNDSLSMALGIFVAIASAALLLSGIARHRRLKKKL